MTSKNTPVAVLKLPARPKALITYAQSVHKRMTDNPFFPSPTPTLTELAADIAALVGAETDAHNRTRGTRSARDAKARALRKTLGLLRDHVQSVVEANAGTVDGVVIIESASMSVRRSGSPRRRSLDVKSNGRPGEVVATTRRVAATATYIWQYSLDQQTWTPVSETMKTRITITGLQSARTYYFRFRAITRAGDTGYSQVVSCVVQ